MSNPSPKPLKDPVKISPKPESLWPEDVKLFLQAKSFQYSLVIIVVAFISFFPVLKGGFLQTWDDEKYVTGNLIIKDLSAGSIGRMFTRQVNGTYVPLPLLTYAIEYKLFGDNPVPFHATNLILHILCALLVFRILRLLKLDLIYAAFGALLFAIHPMRVESVAWITERKDVLYAFFYLSSIIAYISYVTESAQKQKYLIFSIILFAGSLLSKIEAVTLPVSLLLIDYWLQRPFRMKLLTEKIPYFILSLFFGLLGIFIIYRVGVHMPDFLKTDKTLSFSDRLFYGLYAFTGYIIKFFVPYSQCAVYPYPVMTGWTMIWIRFINPVLIGILAFLIWWSVRRTRAFAFGILFLLGNIFLLLQIIAVGNGFFADRYSYIPYFGLIFLTVWFVEKIGKNNRKGKKWGFVILSAFAILCSVLTFTRAKVWQDEVSFWTDVIVRYPDRGMEPYANRGVAYTVRHEWNNAVDDYTKALSIGPVSAGVYADRGIVYGMIGQPEKAIADFSNSIRLDSGNTKALFNRGVAYSNTNQAEKAITDLKEVLVLDTLNVSAYAGLCLLLMEEKKYDTCRILAGKGLSLDPYRSELYAVLGNCELESGDPEKAVNEFRHCLRIDNTSLDAYMGLAATFVIKDDKANAMQNLGFAREVAQQQNIMMDHMEDIIRSGIPMPDKKRAAIQKLLSK